MFINWRQREINLKVVYYGPALSGKTTNLEQIHARVNPQRRGELTSLKTHEDRTLFFDFIQVELGKIGGLTPKLHLYTVPGQTYYDVTRKLVLRGADGVVFVADSAVDRLEYNLESWQDMKTQLGELDIPFINLPLVVQFNKRDLPNVMLTNTLQSMLRINGIPTYEAIATQGQGVFDTLKAIVNRVVIQVQKEMA
jgi:signal recognition particle receptor subunit beta